ncbi:MAG TPA: hypothetical protein VFR48_01815 [Solirubrobacteraceae bacterium]|nr:hypothetical protein [Solirubrobacteraceae bacterium]
MLRLATPVLLGALAGCGSSSSAPVSDRSADANRARTAAALAAPQPRVPDTNDLDDDPTSNDDSFILAFGKVADAVQRRSLAAFVKRYYHVAARGSGSDGCSMLLATTAEAIAEEAPPRPGAQTGNCAGALARLFAQNRRALAAEVPSLRVRFVRINEPVALVVMNFATTPELRTIVLAREGSAWKVKQPLDGGMP